MIYINNPKDPYITYDDACDIAINSGIDRKRVYIYLAMLGVTSAKGRIISDDLTEYNDAIKLAVNKKGELIKSIKPCNNCSGLIIL